MAIRHIVTLNVGCRQCVFSYSYIYTPPFCCCCHNSNHPVSLISAQQPYSTHHCWGGQNRARWDQVHSFVSQTQVQFLTIHGYHVANERSTQFWAAMEPRTQSSLLAFLKLTRKRQHVPDGGNYRQTATLRRNGDCPASSLLNNRRAT